MKAKVNKFLQVEDYSIEETTIEVDAVMTASLSEFHESVNRKDFEKWVKENNYLNQMSDDFDHENNHSQTHYSLSLEDYYEQGITKDLEDYITLRSNRFKKFRDDPFGELGKSITNLSKILKTA